MQTKGIVISTWIQHLPITNYVNAVAFYIIVFSPQLYYTYRP